MLRAMQDVVSPAIDPSNSLAREQAALVIGQLRLLAVQWSRAEEYAGVCLEDLEQSLEGLEPSGGGETARAFEDLTLTSGTRTEHRIEDHYKAVMRAADNLVRAADVDGTAGFRSALRNRLLGFSKRQAVRDRSWFALSGFDLRPEELSPIDELIGRN